MTEAHEKIIIDYLLHKKLTLDIASEVFDHMEIQIRNKIQEGLTFDETWTETRRSWLPELKTTYDPRYSFDDITLLMKKLAHTEVRRMMKQAVPLVCILLIMHLLLMRWLPETQLKALFILTNGIYFGLMGWCLYKNLKVNKLRKKFPNNLLVINFETYYVPLVAFAGVMGGLLNYETWQHLYALLRGQSATTGDTASGVYLIFVLLFMYFSLVVFVMNSKRIERKISTLQPFLEKVQQIQ